MTAGEYHHGAHLLRLTLDLSQSRRNEQYERAQKDAWRSIALKAFDENRQLSQRLALLDSTLDRRYLRAWEERRAAWLAEAWAAGRPADVTTSRRVA